MRHKRHLQVHRDVETEYEKIKYIFKYLVDTVDYDQNALDNQNIYSSLVGKKSVCAGYSRAAQYLLKQMGIECIYVVGTVKEQGAHAWNIVKCDDKYYQMDVTFGDPIFQENETGETLPHDLVNYEYLCCTDEEIFTDHQQDDFVPYPVCDSNDLEYYRINGLYYETFDENEIYEKMKAGIEQGQEMFAIRFSENAVYEVAKEKIIDNLIPQAAQFLVDFRQLEEVKYTYAVDDRKRISNDLLVFIKMHKIPFISKKYQYILIKVLSYSSKMMLKCLSCCSIIFTI